MSIMKKVALVTSVATGGTLTAMEGTMLWYGEEEGGLKTILEREYAEPPKPRSLSIELSPEKLTYKMNDIVEIKTVIKESSGKVLELKNLKDFELSLTSNRPFLKVEGDSAILKGTGKAIIKGCLDLKQTSTDTESGDSSDRLESTEGVSFPICHEVEVMIIDEALPF